MFQVNFEVKSPIASSGDSYIICGLPNDVEDLIGTPMAAKIAVNGITLIDTADTSSISNFPAFTTVSTPEYIITLFKIPTFSGFQFSIIINEQNVYKHIEEVYKPFDFYFKFSRTGYQTYENTITFYNYSYNNNNLITPFQIYLLEANNPTFISGQQTLPFSSFITVRKPYTGEIHIYKTFGGQGNIEYYDQNDTLIVTGGNGLYCNKNNTTLKQIVTIGNLTCVSFIDVDFEKSIPTFDVNTSCTICNLEGDEYSVNGTVTAKPTIDFTDLSIYYNGHTPDGTAVERFATQYYTLIYELYKIDGTLMYTQKNYISTYPQPFIFTPSSVQATFNLTDKGDYILKVILKHYNETSYVVPVGDNLIKDEWYVISKIGSSFTGIGAPNNDIQTAFVYNGGTVNWSGGGELTALGSSISQTRMIKIRGCERYEVTKQSCNSYLIENLSTDTVTCIFYKMNDKGQFEEYSLMPSIILTPSQNKIVDFKEDGEYYISIGKQDNENLNDISIILVHAYCNLRNCLTNFIGKELCIEKSCKCNNGIKKSCEDICEKVYDFNSLIINSFAYFNLLNKYQTLSYIYTALDDNTISDLFTMQTFLNKFKEYCDTCNCSCNCK